jgi:putative copper export protein
MDIHSLIMWIHLLAATIWVGPQVFLFVAGVPAIRSIEPAAARLRALEIMTKRYSYLAGGALALLVLTGLANADYRLRLIADPFALRYGWLLLGKVALVGLVIVLTAWHSFSLGPRLLALQRIAAQGSPALERQAYALRRQSIVVSALILSMSIVILIIVVLLQSGYAYEAV